MATWLILEDDRLIFELLPFFALRVFRNAAVFMASLGRDRHVHGQLL